MKHAKHTPGPWRSNPYQHPMIHGYAVYSDKACLDKIADDIKSESNARLIAAAPELLEALEHIARCVTCNGDMVSEIKLQGDEVTKVFKAIAKARGES